MSKHIYNLLEHEPIIIKLVISEKNIGASNRSSPYLTRFRKPSLKAVQTKNTSILPKVYINLEFPKVYINLGFLGKTRKSSVSKCKTNISLAISNTS